MVTNTHDDKDRPFYEAVYDMLVQHGGALSHSTDKGTFVRYFTHRGHKATEYRCVRGRSAWR